MEFFKALVLIGGSTLAVAFLIAGIRIYKSDSGDYDNNKIITGRIINPMLGNISTFRDGVRDYHVKSGLAVDIKKRIWMEQGALSEESIDNILG